MAQVERQRENARDQRAKARAEKIKTRRSGRTAVDVQHFPWPEFVGVLATILAEGGAVRIGLTRDGGAWAFGLYGLGDPLTLYLNSNDDPFEFLEQIREAYTDDEQTS